MQRSFLLKLILSFEYLLISATGFCLLFFGLVDQGYKIEVLSTTFVISFVPISFRLYTKEWSFKDLGFRLDNFFTSILKYSIATVAGVMFLVLYSFIFETHKKVDENTLFFYSFWGAIAQELLYRGYLMKLGKEIFGEGRLAILMNIFIFVGMHAFYPGFLQKLLILIPAGVLFTLLYKRYPNIILISISHIVLNATAVMLGVFS
jgi:membrane protease YdiL (CAAX protease family)